MITDTPYSQVYWYVKGPRDTSALGTEIETVDGDGAKRKTVFSYTFPLADGDEESSGAFYKITAYVYRWDQSVYWESYNVWVVDQRGHD